MLTRKDKAGSEEVEEIMHGPGTESPSELLPLSVERQAEDRVGDGGPQFSLIPVDLVLILIPPQL